jgi:hypothetical protein
MVGKDRAAAHEPRQTELFLQLSAGGLWIIRPDGYNPASLGRWCHLT